MAEQTTTVPRAHIYRVLLSDAFERAKGIPFWNEAFRAALAGRGLALVEPGAAFLNPGDVYPDDAPLEAPTCNIGPCGWPAKTVVAWAPNMLSNGSFNIPPGANPLTLLHNGEMILPRAFADKIREQAQILSTITRDQAVEIARSAAQQDSEGHDYCAEAKTDPTWQPHAWVVEAILQAARPPVRHYTFDGSSLADFKKTPESVVLRRWTIRNLDKILAEVDRATLKFPTWPDDPLHAIAILGEEFGELTKDCLQSTYEPHKVTAEDVASEAIQTAAMALRFAMSLGRYQFKPSTQHSQGGGE